MTTMKNWAFRNYLFLIFVFVLILVNISSCYRVFGADQEIKTLSSQGSIVRKQDDQISGIKWSTRNENGIYDWTVGGGWNGRIEADPPHSTLTAIDMLGKTWIRSRIDDPS